MPFFMIFFLVYGSERLYLGLWNEFFLRPCLVSLLVANKIHAACHPAFAHQHAMPVIDAFGNRKWRLRIVDVEDVGPYIFVIVVHGSV